MHAKAIHELLERLSNLMRNEARRVGATDDLLPIQLEALHYLSLCNRYSDTPMGLTDYLGQTKGTVSQSVKVLEKKGFVNKVADQTDKRITHLQVTKAGRRLLDSVIPAPILQSACAPLSEPAQVQIVTSLSILLRALQQANGLKTFGVCHTCRHNQTLADGFWCGLTQEPLSGADIQLICREHDSS